jgi:hypothetical protein
MRGRARPAIYERLTPTAVSAAESSNGPGLRKGASWMSDIAEAVHRYLQWTFGARLPLFSDLGMAGGGFRDPNRVLVLVKQVEDPACTSYFDLPLLQFAAAVNGCGQVSTEAAVPCGFRPPRGCAHQVPGLAGIAGCLGAKSLPARRRFRGSEPDVPLPSHRWRRCTVPTLRVHPSGGSGTGP